MSDDESNDNLADPHEFEAPLTPSSIEIGLVEDRQPEDPDENAGNEGNGDNLEDSPESETPLTPSSIEISLVEDRQPEDPDENAGNEGNDNLEYSPESEAPLTPSSIDTGLDEVFKFTFDNAILKDENFSVFGKEWSLEKIIEKFGQDEPFQLPASEREPTIRNLVGHFFSTYIIPPDTLRVSEKCFVGQRYIPGYVKSFRVGDFFSSQRTRFLRNLYYDSYIKFEDLTDPYSVNSLTYKDEMQIKYIPFKLFRILFLDILDFIDFLEGSELPPSFFVGNVAIEVQLAKIRDEFENGIQQIEFDTIDKLEIDFNSFILQSPPEANKDILSFEIFQLSEYESYMQSPPSVKRRYYELDPELDHINDEVIHGKQLKSLQEILGDFTYSAISRSAALLAYCHNTPVCQFQSSIQRLIFGIFEQLDQLKDLRMICTRMLAVLKKSDNPNQTLLKLKLKVKIALLLRDMFGGISGLIRSFSFHKD